MTRHPWRQAAILAAITFAVFAPTLSAEFVYDARMQILTDPFPHDPRHWPAVLSFAVLGMDVLDFNRPVQLASIMLDAALWGRDPFGYHLTSILLHSVNVVLLWFVLRDVLARGRRAAGAAGPVEDATWAVGIAACAGALFFALHPIVTEAVCEPTYREDLLVAAFTLGAVALASGHAAAGGDHLRAVGCAACCLFACASKESGIAAPCVLAAYWWLFRRGEAGRFWSIAGGGGLAATLLFMVARFLLEPAKSVIFASKPTYVEGSLWAAMQLQPRLLALYAQLVVWPANLSADYGGPSILHLPLGLSLGILTALAIALTLAGRRDRRIAFGAALMVLPLLPVSNLVPIYRAAADRYLYVPLTGVALIVACLVEAAWRRVPKNRRPVGLAAGMAVLAILAFACVGRQRVWANSLSLWHDTLTRNPVSYSAATGLATAFREAGRFADSERAAQHALRLCAGRRGDAWLALAFALEGQGRTAEADKAVATALARNPLLADPDARVAALAMERSEAAALKPLLARRAQQPAATPPLQP